MDGGNTTSSTTTTTTVDPQLLLVFRVYVYSCFYFILPLFPAAVFCEVCTIIIFAATPIGATKTTRIYYLTIAIGQLVTLIWKEGLFYLFGVGFFAVGLLTKGMWSVLADRDWCPADSYSWYLSETVANNAFVALAIERVLVLYLPLKAKAIVRRRNAIIGMLVLTAASAAVNSIMIELDTPAVNSLYPGGYSCSAQSNKGIWTLISPLKYVTNYIWPAFASSILSVVIIVKIRKASNRKASLANLEKSNLSKSEVESCVTLIALSLMHIALYVPLAIFRICYLILPLVTTLPSVTNSILGVLGSMLYVSVMPVHFFNFAVYCRRVRQFSANVRRLVTCRKLITSVN